ncbi:S8 family peptidase [Ornithinibacillus gellani]|uniref:S8 family peptidase n=1 Tax=Ornithinibacillus gellani TaxID=2293253 RepID=UPI001CC1D1D5|nr:S8 family serine peptidase [Ornithinibacillus gellani]
MKFHAKLKKIGIVSFTLCFILFSLLLAVFIQPPASNALMNSTSKDKQQHTPGKAETNKHVITLITGDVVTVTDIEGGDSVVTVESPSGTNEGIRMHTVGDDTYVIPDGAMPYLASGLLDRELFNITSLIEFEYDDSSRDTLPLIIQYEEKPKAKAFSATKTFTGASHITALESIQSIALLEDKEEAATFWDQITAASDNKQKLRLSSAEASFSDGIEKIWLDGKVEATLAESVPQIGAPDAWESGFDGEGITVAVLDTGIDNEHPDVASQLKQMETFVPNDDGMDRHGHGTHVASTVLGNGAASDGLYTGVAPGADLITGKVLDDTGFGQESWIISAMEWAADHADIVNMSLGSNYPTDGTDPMAQALNQISEAKDVLFVVAAGNAGMEHSIGSPGSADAALTVGNVDKSDNLAPLSSMGPRIGDMAMKPDLVAPGEEIIAARSQFAGVGSGDYLGMSGTSMASPHVAGAAAILKQKHPEWSATEIKHAMMSTTEQLGDYQPHQVGTGRLDIATTLSADITASGPLSYGLFKWPHDDAEPVEKTVTYTNYGDQDVTLDLSTTFTTDNGTEAPERMLQLSDAQITVPANGNTEIIVTLDPNFGETGTRYWGYLNADLDGTTVVHTSIGMVKEEEKYPLTLEATNRDGSPGVAYVEIIGPTLRVPEYVTVIGSAEVRLPKGNYSAMSMMDVDVGTSNEGVALVGNPEITLDQPVTVALDAQQANEITVDIPKEADTSYHRLEYFRQLDGASINSLYMVPHLEKTYAVPTNAVEKGEFEMLSRWRLIKPILSISKNEQALRITPLPGMKTFNGKQTLEAVYAENGAADAYQDLDVTDKAVVVKRNPDMTADEQANVALDAGAKLLLIANNSPGHFNELVGSDDALIPLAVASINGQEGDALIAQIEQGGVTLDVEGTQDSPYVYDLVDAHVSGIPADLNYAPDPEDLVKIDSTYIADEQAIGTEFRYDRRRHSVRAWGFQEPISLPMVREEWVSATEGSTWYQQAEMPDGTNPYTAENSWEIRGIEVNYNPGERLQENWFSPVIQPRFGLGFWTPFQDNYGGFQFNVPAQADAGEQHTGWMSDWNKQSALQNLKLYQDHSLLGEAKGQMLITWDELPDENLEYRLVSETTNGEHWNTSTQTRTEWTFWSEGGVSRNVDLPLLSLNYKTDMNSAGHLIAGRTAELTLDVTKIPGVGGYGNIDETTLQASYDQGKTWEEIALTKDGQNAIAQLDVPKNAVSISLKANASDDAGNKITQEIIDAYNVTLSGAAEMQAMLNVFKEDGNVSPAAARALEMHLTTLKRFEETESADKVVKHIDGLQQLLEHHVNQETISGKAYNLFNADAEYVRKAWE